MMPFTGSYRAEDTVFLLKPIAMAMVDVASKERLIQSGRRHYSELLAPEQVPDSSYLELLEALTARYARRLAGEVLALACYLRDTRPGPVSYTHLDVYKRQCLACATRQNPRRL